MTPQIDPARFETHEKIRSRCTSFDTEDCCHVESYCSLNRYSETVEIVTLACVDAESEFFRAGGYYR